MLTALSIRDIVLIEKLDLALDGGITVLTGETGAGKSILLDALGLALGARGDSALVRTGQAKGSITVAFTLPKTHAALALLAEREFDIEGELVIRRTQGADGGSKATINDQPASVNLLRQVAATLVELHGQHADRALVDVAEHRRLVDAFGGLEAQAASVETSWNALSAARKALEEHRELLARAEAERDYLENAVSELAELSPLPNEERELADARQLMMQSEQYIAAINDLESALNGEAGSQARINAALRKLERRKEAAAGRLDPLCLAADRLLAEYAETQRALDDARRSFDFNQQDLEKSEERLFALRAAARKYRTTVDELAGVRDRFDRELQAITDGGTKLDELDKAHATARTVYEEEADKLSAARIRTAKALTKAVLAELPALKLERSRFETRVEPDATRQGPHGIDRIEFVVAANPGTPLQPLMKVASGGELARFMLALKVVLASKGSAPVLIFDEIDTGVGGAVADAIGKRLVKLGESLQVIAVTHSPQVAARAGNHLLISKMEDVKSKRMVTRVQPLSPQSRREELARMLSGSTVTEEARAQADRLLAGQE